jgi:hypothetical protein
VVEVDTATRTSAVATPLTAREVALLDLRERLPEATGIFVIDQPEATGTVVVIKDEVTGTWRVRQPEAIGTIRD